jgi:WD40 repeat protein
LNESLSSFCFQHLLHWIEALSLFGELSLAIPALTNARKWCEVSGSNLREQLRLTLNLQQVWSLVTGLLSVSLEGYLENSEVSGVAFSSDSKRIASRSKQEIRIWDTTEAVLLLKLTSNRTLSSNILFSPDASQIVIGRATHVALWCSRTGELQTKFDVPYLRSISQIVFSPNGQYLAMRGHTIDRTLGIRVRAPVMQIWSYQRSAVHKVIQQYEEGTGLAFTPDSTRIASASSSKVFIWDVLSGRILSQIDICCYKPVSFSFGWSRGLNVCFLASNIFLRQGRLFQS